MVSLEAIQTASRSIDLQGSSYSPRISFSAEFLDESNFISISPNNNNIVNPVAEKEITTTTTTRDPKSITTRNPVDFEFLSSSNMSSHKMLTADELFFEGKLLPFWQMQQQEKLNKITLKSSSTKDHHHQSPGGQREENSDQVVVNSNNKEEPRCWFVDDDPSPRPPKCTVLWKELLRLKKQRANSSLSPSSSSSSTSSSSSSLADVATKDLEGKEGNNRRVEKQVKRIKKGLERTRSASIRIRPMVNVPICTQVKSNSALPPLFPLKKGRLER